MEDKLKHFLEKVGYEGLDYAVTKYSNFDELEDLYPTLYEAICEYRYASDVLEDIVNPFMDELEEEEDG